MLRSTVIATTLAAAGLGLSATPALADPQRFDLTSGKTDTQGTARGVGTVSVERKGRRLRFVVNGRLNDRCPADGFSAFLELRYYYDVHQSGYTYGDLEVVDDRTCGKKAMHFRRATKWIRPKDAATLSHVTVQVGEVSHESGIATDYNMADRVFAEFSYLSLRG